MFQSLSYIRVAKCCVSLGESREAREVLEKARASEPSNATVKQELSNVDMLEQFRKEAGVAFDAGDHRKALFCIDRAIGIAIASRQLKIWRAECLALLGRTPEAQELANDLLRQDSRHEGTLIVVISAHSTLNLPLFIRCADAVYVRGLCLYYEDNVAKAFTHFQHVLRLAPDHEKAQDIYKVINGGD